MAVLVEALSVIIRRDAIDKDFRGGWGSFVFEIPNRTLCYDDELARVGFLSPPSVRAFTEMLERNGLTFFQNEKAQQIVVVDQQEGLTAPCNWLEFAKLRFDYKGRLSLYGGSEKYVSACWLYEGPRDIPGIHMRGSSMKLSVPQGWEFEGSASDKFTFTPDEFNNQ